VASIPGEATLTLKSMFGRRAFGAPETLDLVLGFAGGVASGVVANWLYGKLKGRNVRLRIEEHEVEIEEGEIKRIISRVTEKSE
jgi:hypothetical protein